MTWGELKKLYPHGTVFFNVYTTPIEKLLKELLPTEETRRGDCWMYETINYNDQDLHRKNK